MSSPNRSRRPARERHLYLVPPLPASEAPSREPETKVAPTFPWDIPATAPYGQPWAGRPAYTHTIPTTPPSPDWADHPPRKRVQWVRTGQED